MHIITIQNNEKDIISLGTTIIKAIDNAGIPSKKYHYIRKLLYYSSNNKVVWKGYTIIKHKL